MYADQATVQDPVGSDPIRGKKAIAAFFTPLLQTRRETELLNLRHSGDSAAFHFRVSAYTADGVVTIEPFDVMTFDVEGNNTSTRSILVARGCPDVIRSDDSSHCRPSLRS